MEPTRQRKHRTTWRKESELKEQGHKWNWVLKLAPNRVRWREFVNGGGKGLR